MENHQETGNKSTEDAIASAVWAVTNAEKINALSAAYQRSCVEKSDKKIEN